MKRRQDRWSDRFSWIQEIASSVKACLPLLVRRQFTHDRQLNQLVVQSLNLLLRVSDLLTQFAAFRRIAFGCQGRDVVTAGADAKASQSQAVAVSLGNGYPHPSRLFPLQRFGKSNRIT